MKHILSLFMLFLSATAYSQSAIDTTIKLDLLRAPASPASNLLGIAPGDIEKPTDLSAFMVSLYSATEGLSKLPSSYAVDISPYWLLSKKPDNSIESFMKRTGKEVTRQTFMLSLAYRNTDSTETKLNKNSIYGGLGFKISFLRGRLSDEASKNFRKIKEYQRDRVEHMKKVLKSMDTLTALREMRDSLKMMLRSGGSTEDQKYKELQARLNAKAQAFKDSPDGEEGKSARLQKEEAELAARQAEIQKLAAAFQIERVGWNVELAGGISTEFRNKQFNNTRVNNAGLWLTAGHNGEKGSTFLFMLRYLYNPDKIFALDNNPNNKKTGNISTLDGGLKYCYSTPQSKFNISLEALYRSVLSSNTIDPSYRLVLNADYSIWMNQKLTFSFGRNFDGTITKDGNLIAALGFITGLGNNR